jgi:hypothetical protein
MNQQGGIRKASYTTLSSGLSTVQCLFVSKRSPAPTMTAKSGIICPTLYVPRWEVMD